MNRFVRFNIVWSVTFGVFSAVSIAIMTNRPDAMMWLVWFHAFCVAFHTLSVIYWLSPRRDSGGK